MKRLLMSMLVAVTLAGPAYGQAPSRSPSPDALKAAQELASLMSGDTVGQMSAAMTAQIWPAIQRQLGPKVDAGTLTELRGEFEQSLAAFSKAAMTDAPAVYARHFTAQELRELLAFYKSPVGAKALQTMPAVMAELGQEMAPRIQAFQAELHAKMEATLKKHGYDK
ncbi:MAG TPA: DUF2059 domain-containing protein [Pseudolabrys sp.]|nr:DUF2059 domain-containing protein [Pseudolabrys sp.]